MQGKYNTQDFPTHQQKLIEIYSRKSYTFYKCKKNIVCKDKFNYIQIYTYLCMFTYICIYISIAKKSTKYFLSEDKQI